MPLFTNSKAKLNNLNPTIERKPNMKKFLIATTAVFALFAAPTFACETKAIAGSNATQKVDPNCQFPTQGGGSFLLFGVDSVDDDNDPSTPNINVGALKTNLTDPATTILSF
jgi:hypothetical protein